MNTKEGAHRIILLGKRIMRGSLAGFALWLLKVFLNLSGRTYPGAAPFELVFWVMCPLLLGGGLWAIGWIVQGFTKSDEGVQP